VYLVTAVVVSALAARARSRAAEAEQREREAALLAEAADALLRGVEVVDELERLEAPLADVLGVVSARIELGSPLPQGYALRLRDEDRRALLATILEESARLGRLVENLLDLSRLQAEAAQPRAELWPPEELIAQALDELAEGNARVVLELDEEVPPVRVDAV